MVDKKKEEKNKERTQEHLLLVLVIVPVSMRGFDLILSKVDRRTS